MAKVTQSTLKDYRLAVRDVHDRTIGTFEHNVASLRDNSFALVMLPGIGEVGLISKARNYSETPYDVMIACLDDSVGTIHRMSNLGREWFFKLVRDIYKIINEESGLRIAIGINQHPEAFRLPERDERGNKNRAQTLAPIHAHLYEVSAPAKRFIRMADLEKAEQRDICDPMIMLASELALASLQRIDTLNKQVRSYKVELATPPWGLNIEFRVSLTEFLNQDVAPWATIQGELFQLHENWRRSLNPGLTAAERNDGVAARAKMLTLSDHSRRLLGLLSANLRKRSEEAKPELLFTQGAAVTYTLYEDRGRATLNIHPRLMSKGNSADSFGLYVNNSEGEPEEELLAKRAFYARIIRKIQTDYAVRQGPFMSRGD